MEHRSLEINVVSAKDLNKVNFISKMDVYVTVSLSGAGDKANQKQKTPVAQDGDTNPSWNYPMKFTIDEAAARQNRHTLVFKLRSQRALGDKDIGEVHVPIKELIESPAADGKQQFVSYQVRKPNGKPKGQLTLSYKFGEKIAGSASPVKPGYKPVTAYPAAAASTAYPMAASTSSVYPPPATAYPVAAGGGAYPPPKDGAYPPPATAYPVAAGGGAYPPAKDGGAPPPQPGGYPPPPQGGYGYAYTAPPPYGGYPPGPPPPGYGYPPPPPPGYGGGYVQQPVKPPKKNKFGMGLGAGLLGGALGGLILGDMVSDAGGFDGGFDCDF